MSEERLYGGLPLEDWENHSTCGDLPTPIDIALVELAREIRILREDAAKNALQGEKLIQESKRHRGLIESAYRRGRRDAEILKGNEK